MKGSILAVLILGTAASVLSQEWAGYGCREADLPNSIRVDCHPEPNATPDECRIRGCVWCEPEDDGTDNDYPSCFYRDLSYNPSGPSCDAGYVPPNERVDCANGQPIGEWGCRQKNCTWCPDVPGSGNPWCFVPAAIDNTGYSMVGQPVQTPNGVRVEIAKSFKNGKSQFEGEAPRLTLEAEFQSDYRLRVKITDGTPRYEVPLEIFPATGGNANLLYDIQFVNGPPFSFRVVRRSSGAVLFDSSAGKLQFADQFLTMSWRLPTDNVYGLGENEQRSFKHDFGEQLKYTLYASDLSPMFTAPIYGVHPHYTVLEADGNAHAVVLVNSNAQEFRLLPGPMLKYITIGGIFDMYFFLGPTPDDTVKQYTEAVGRSQMPPYWGLGFQLCRWGYDHIDKMKEAVDRTEMYGIPHDVQYGDIDIMRDELDFTYDNVSFAGLPEYILELKEKGIRFVTILDPFISIIEPEDYEPLTLGNEMDVWYKKADGTPVVGRVWPHDAEAPVYFPDYSKNSTREWWIYLVAKFHDLLAYDGLWIDMNEPANFEFGDMYEGCANNTLNFPPYMPGYSKSKTILHYKTLCGDHKDSVSNHYNTHSLYGWFESEPTLLGTRLGTGKRGLVLSRSTFLGSGRWTTHWLGDNFSLWSNLHYSIIGTMQFNLWGIPYVGPDICGFGHNSNAQLCQRWMQLGAFYPFSRNHNARGSMEQDPGFFGPEVAASSKKALEVRYTLLPYLYTLFYQHITEGSAVFRPLWYNFVEDTRTYPIDRQFMWGSGLLVSPVLSENTTIVIAYFPDARVYSFYTGEEVETRGSTEQLQAPMDFIHVHFVGGQVVPTQEPARNTMISRQNPMGLVVALDDGLRAEGSLFYDDGEGIDTHLNGEYFLAQYSFGNGILTSTVVHDGFPEMAEKKVETVRLLGAGSVTSVTVNGAAHADWQTLPSGEVLVKGLDLVANSEFDIRFA